MSRNESAARRRRANGGRPEYDASVPSRKFARWLAAESIAMRRCPTSPYHGVRCRLGALPDGGIHPLPCRRNFRRSAQVRRRIAAGVRRAGGHARRARARIFAIQVPAGPRKANPGCRRPAAHGGRSLRSGGNRVATWTASPCRPSGDPGVRQAPRDAFRPSRRRVIALCPAAPRHPRGRSSPERDPGGRWRIDASCCIMKRRETSQ